MDEVEAPDSGPSANRRLSMHSSEGADSEEGDFFGHKMISSEIAL